MTLNDLWLTNKINEIFKTEEEKTGMFEKVKKKLVKEINEEVTEISEEEKAIKEKQTKIFYAAIDRAVYEADHNDVPQTKEAIETVREAQKMIQDFEKGKQEAAEAKQKAMKARLEAEEAKQKRIESWTRIGTTLVKTVVYVGLGIATFELNKQVTLLVFNEQFSKGVIDNRSLSGLLKANDSLKKDIMNNLNRRDGII